MFEHMPFNREVGIEITHAVDGHAEGRIELEDRHSSSPLTQVVHGGVTYALADTVGGAALVSQVDRPVPTIDMRIDYLNAGTGDLRATADVVRLGDDVGVTDVTVLLDDDTRAATARGVYKVG